MQLTPNFKLAEFISARDTINPNQEEVANLKLLAQRLQVLRDLLGVSILINSGFRSKQYNASIGGAENSYHVKGMAADIRIKGSSPLEVQKLLENWSGGLGSYSTFTHVDIRDIKARWNG